MKYVLDTHCHTVASGHAFSTVKEYAMEAAEKGIELIAITDHAPDMPGGAHEYYFENLKIVPKKMFGIEVLTGAELNIMDTNGKVDLRERTLKTLDVVIASLHLKSFRPASIEENTKAVINTMRNPYVKIIGHLGDPRYKLDYDQIVKAAAETGVVLEVNDYSLNPVSHRYGGEEDMAYMLSLCSKFHVPIILGSDAHIHCDIGNFSNADDILKRYSFPDDLVLNTSVSYFKKTLKML